MCAIDGAERCDVWDVITRRAAKPHKCSGCYREIAKGETYRRIGSLYERQWTTTILCAHCTVASDWLNGECGGHLTEGIAEDIREHAEEYHSFGLWRLVSGAKRKWMRFDSAGLMPIPKLPAFSVQP